MYHRRRQRGDQGALRRFSSKGAPEVLLRATSGLSRAHIFLWWEVSSDLGMK